MARSNQRRAPVPAWLAVAGLGAVPLAGLIFFLAHSPGKSATGHPATVNALASQTISVAATPAALASAATRAPSAGALPLTAEARRVEHDDPRRARALLREALARDPRHEPALEALSLKLLHDENHREARELAARCLAVNPDNDDCTLVRDYSLPGGEEADRLAETARAALARNPKDARALGTLVGYSVLTGDLVTARRSAETLAEAEPGAKTTWLATARVASAEGRYDAARRAFAEACRLGGMEQACFRAEALQKEGF